MMKSLVLGSLNSSCVKSRTLGRQSEHVHIESPIPGKHGLEGWRICRYDLESILELCFKRQEV